MGKDIEIAGPVGIRQADEISQFWVRCQFVDEIEVPFDRENGAQQRGLQSLGKLNAMAGLKR